MSVNKAYAVPLFTAGAPVPRATGVHGAVITPGNAFDPVDAAVG